MQLHDLDETEWRLMQELIPQALWSRDARARTTRACINGILWRMRTGRPWNCIPREYGSHSAIWRRFVVWRDTGLWQQMTTMLAQARSSGIPEGRRSMAR